MTQDVLRVTELLETKITPEDGEEFGSIAELILDKTNGTITGVIVRRQGALTATDNFYRLDWAAIKSDADFQTLTLNASETEIGNLPASSSLADLISAKA